MKVWTNLKHLPFLVQCLEAETMCTIYRCRFEEIMQLVPHLPPKKRKTWRPRPFILYNIISRQTVPEVTLHILEHVRAQALQTFQIVIQFSPTENNSNKVILLKRASISVFGFYSIFQRYLLTYFAAAKGKTKSRWICSYQTADSFQNKQMFLYPFGFNWKAIRDVNSKRL